MPNLRVDLPVGTTICDGKQITFKAPCDCSDITALLIDGRAYQLVDAFGNVVAGGNSFTANAMVSVIIDTDEYKAFLQNAVANSFDGYWESGENVTAGDVRFLRGRENSGYILECIQDGVTGGAQPSITKVTEVANYSDLGVVGRMRMIFNIAEKDVDEVLAMGVTYSRLTYPELWDYAQARAGLILTEEEWQAKYAETNGKFVPYYSSGDGSSTFRTPLLGAYAKGAESPDEISLYREAGLPNITGKWYWITSESTANWDSYPCEGAAGFDKYTYSKGVSSSTASTTAGRDMTFDASKSNSIYGNSYTVTPETMTGIWVIKAVGIVVDSGNTDIAQALQAIEQVQSGLTAIDNKITRVSDYIVESYRNGTEWYRIWESGWVEQGGTIPVTSTEVIVNLLKPYSNKDKFTATASVRARVAFSVQRNNASTIALRTDSSTSYNMDWVAVGQGA